MRERDIEAYLIHRVKAMGGEVRKVSWIGRRGAPDRLVMLPQWRPSGDGVVFKWPKAESFWVELKAPGVKAEDHQLREHDRMREMGCRVYVVDSITGVDHLFIS